MKKTLLAIAISAFTITANAHWYVQGDLGVSKTKFTSYSDLNKTKVEPRISAGYRFGDFRVALDYTHYGKFHGDDSRAKIYGIGGSVFYDINLNSAIKPYVGVRVATNIFSVNGNSIKRSPFYSHKEVKSGYGLVTGASYRLTQHVALNGGIEYNQLGNYDDTNVNNYGAKVGIRYEF